MPVTITNIIFESVAFNKIRNCERLETITNFRMKNYIKQFKSIEESYYEEKDRLLKKHKVKPNEKNPAFWEEMNKLFKIDSEVNIDKMKINLNKVPPDNFLTEKEFEVLESIFEFFEDEEEKPKPKKSRKKK